MRSIYVSPSGSADGDGTSKRPYATLEQARDALRASPSPGATVWIRGGDYRLERGLVLEERDGGKPGASIEYRACPGETVRLLGGAVIRDWMPVKSPALLARLSPPAHRHVRVADLKAAGVTDYGKLTRRGFALSAPAAHLELFYGGKPMTVAQYPNAGTFLAISDVGAPDTNEWRQTVGKGAGGFYYRDERPKRWAASDSIWVHGYWSWDWANSYERIERLDPKTGLVRTESPHCAYAFKAGQRFYFLNVLEELDEPGEYYVDAAKGLLFFWPPAGSAGDQPPESLVSVLEEPLIQVKGASHLILRDLVLEAGRSSGVVVKGGSNVVVGGCSIRNMGIDGVAVEGGYAHRIEGCEIAHPGDCGVTMSGGDRKTLAQADYAVENNHIHHVGRWSRTYKAAINAFGCGIRIVHNRIHDGPHTAILYWGNEISIDYNEIFRMCLETGDAGAIYTGRDYTFRGNRIRWNCIYQMGGVGMGTSAIYMDDCVSGHLIEGNVVRGGDAIWLGGGRDFVIRDNWFIDCKGSICFDARGVSPDKNWQTMVNTTMRERCEEMGAWAPPYTTRYPELSPLKAYFEAGKGVPPENNVALSNWCVRCELVAWRVKDPEPGWLRQEGNVEDPEPGFADPAKGDFRLGPDSKAIRAGFKPPLWETCGLTATEYRVWKDAER